MSFSKKDVFETDLRLVQEPLSYTFNRNKALCQVPTKEQLLKLKQTKNFNNYFITFAFVFSHCSPAYMAINQYSAMKFHNNDPKMFLMLRFNPMQILEEA